MFSTHAIHHFLILLFHCDLQGLDYCSFLWKAVVGKKGKIITHKVRQTKINHRAFHKQLFLHLWRKGATLNSFLPFWCQTPSANKPTGCTLQVLPIFWLSNNQISATFWLGRSPAPLPWKLSLWRFKPSLSWFSLPKYCDWYMQVFPALSH